MGSDDIERIKEGNVDDKRQSIFQGGVGLLERGNGSSFATRGVHLVDNHTAPYAYTTSIPTTAGFSTTLNEQPLSSFFKTSKPTKQHIEIAIGSLNTFHNHYACQSHGEQSYREDISPTDVERDIHLLGEYFNSISEIASTSATNKRNSTNNNSTSASTRGLNQKGNTNNPSLRKRRRE